MFNRVVYILKLFISKGYMQIRNTLIILDRLKNVFPCIKKHAQAILIYFEKMSKDLEFEDLKSMAESYEKMLRRKFNTLPDVDFKELKRSMNSTNKNKNDNEVEKKKTTVDNKKDEKKKDENEKKKDEIDKKKDSKERESNI